MATSESYSSKKCIVLQKSKTFERGDTACVDALDGDSSLPCRVQSICVQEEQAKDGAGRKNGHRT